MATIARENISNLTDKITVKVGKDDYYSSFEKKLKEYGKTANISGFRKGMVPAGMIKKMYGAGIFQDEVLRSVEKELYKYLTDEKPEIFAQPLPMTRDVALDMAAPAEYDFDFEIGLKPEVSLPDLNAMGLTYNKVEVTDAMLDEEIGRMQMKGGKMTEPEVIDNDENVLNVLFTEIDEKGEAIEGGIEKENSVLLKYFTPNLQKELKSKKKGDTLEFTLADTFEADKLEAIVQDLGLDVQDAEATKKRFKLEIVKVGLIEKRELDEEFFGEVFPGKEVKTEEEFRKQLKDEMEIYWASQSKNQLHDQVYHRLLEDTKMEFPEAFLKRWLQTGGEKPKSEEQVEEEFPAFTTQLKWTLISDKIIEDNKLEAAKEEIQEVMRQEVMQYFGQMNMGEDMSWLEGYLDRMMQDKDHVEATYRKVIISKVFDHITKDLKTTEKTVTPEELAGMQHSH